MADSASTKLTNPPEKMSDSAPSGGKTVNPPEKMADSAPSKLPNPPEKMADSTPSERKTVTLVSSDGVEFVVDEAVAIQCRQVSNMIEDGCIMGPVPVAKVDSKVLATVLEYCKKHAHDAGIPLSELKKFDEQYVDVSTDELYDLLMAANFLTCQGLLNFLAKHIANMISGKSSEEIRQMFNIKNDLEDKEKDKEKATAKGKEKVVEV